MQASGCIIGGKVVPCDRPVLNWNDHGMEFTPGKGGRRVVPKTVVDLCVWHWTGGEGSVRTLYDVLDTRELGVEWFIGGGQIHQFCDPLFVDAFGAGKYNPRAVSVEVQNYGFRKNVNEIPHNKRGARAVYTTIQNGRKREFAEFYRDDLECVVALAKAISAAIPTIPLRTPVTELLAPYPNYIEPRDMRSVSGHVGHYHLSDQKSDPGPQLLSHLVKTGTCQPLVFTPG